MNYLHEWFRLVDLLRDQLGRGISAVAHLTLQVIPVPRGIVYSLGVMPDGWRNSNLRLRIETR